MPDSLQRKHHLSQVSHHFSIVILQTKVWTHGLRGARIQLGVPLKVHNQQEVFLIYFYNLHLSLSLDSLLYKCLKN